MEIKSQSRCKRIGMGLNTGVAIFFSAVLSIMVNYISFKFFFRVDLSQARYFMLSDSTTLMLENLQDNVFVTILGSPSHPLYRDVQYLLREYDYASQRIVVDYVDPDRDLARADELAIEYNVASPNIIILASGKMNKIVSFDEMVEYYNKNSETENSKPIKEFRGELAISSAIQSFIFTKEQVVYFLSGHGEGRIDNYDQHTGYSKIARALERDGIVVKSLLFGDVSSMPDDCSALVVAGPTRALARAEVDIIKAYLNNGGRLFLLLDAGVITGMKELLNDWGVQLTDDRVVGPTLTGRELVIADYGEHVITKPLKGIRTILNSPRSVRSLVSSDSNGVKIVDRPRVTALALTPKSGWADMTPSQSPLVFDRDVDVPGPVSVAVAVEIDALRSLDLKLARMVVIGDSSMISNGALSSGYSPDLFLSGLNWLLERESFLNIASKTPAGVKVVMTLKQARVAGFLMAVGVPSVLLVVGVMVWVARRR